jgi:hypothetical protein
MFSSLRQYNYGGLVPFYDAVVIPKEGDAAIFAGYHVSLNSAKSYIDKTYPGKYYVTYQKIYLSDEPSVMEVNGVELK